VGGQPTLLFWSETPPQQVQEHDCQIEVTRQTPKFDNTVTREEAAGMVDDLFAALEPVVRAADLELVDVELKSGVLLVTVDRTGGVDLEALTDANRAVSEVLDETDPIPGKYTLEVSSPGVERTLRTPAHFIKAVGEMVTVKTRPQVPGDRRLRGELLAADQDGLELAVEGAPEGRLRLAYSDIDRARTVFQWGPGPRPGAGKGKATGGKGPVSSTKTEKNRKQVVTP
jgi:ribosome maturation factor RimP